MLNVYGEIIPNLLEPDDSSSMKDEFLYAAASSGKRIVLARRYELREDSEIDGLVPIYSEGSDEVSFYSECGTFGVGETVFITPDNSIISPWDASKYAFKVISEDEFKVLQRQLTVVKGVFDALNLTDAQLYALRDMISDHLAH